MRSELCEPASACSNYYYTFMLTQRRRYEKDNVVEASRFAEHLARAYEDLDKLC